MDIRLDILDNFFENLFGSQTEYQKKCHEIENKAKEYEKTLEKIFLNFKDKNQENARNFHVQYYQKVKGYDDFLTQLLIKYDQLQPQTEDESKLRKKGINFIQSIQKNIDKRMEEVRMIMNKDVIIIVPETELSIDQKIQLLEVEAQEAIKLGNPQKAGDLGYQIYYLKASKNKKE